MDEIEKFINDYERKQKKRKSFFIRNKRMQKRCYSIINRVWIMKFKNRDMTWSETMRKYMENNLWT